MYRVSEGRWIRASVHMILSFSRPQYQAGSERSRCWAHHILIPGEHWNKVQSPFRHRPVSERGVNSVPPKYLGRKRLGSPAAFRPASGIAGRFGGQPGGLKGLERA